MSNDLLENVQMTERARADGNGHPSIASEAVRLLGYPVGAAVAVLIVWLATGTVHYGIVLGSVLFVSVLGGYRLYRHLAAKRRAED
jgi:Flp pilus assembly protein TadB